MWQGLWPFPLPHEYTARVNKAWILRALALVIAAYALYSHDNLGQTIARLIGAAAVGAISIRWSHPKYRSQAMIAALCLGAAAFVIAQQVDFRQQAR